MANENNHEQMAPQREKRPNRGQFRKNDPRAVEAGRKGGQASRGGGRRPVE